MYYRYAIIKKVVRKEEGCGINGKKIYDKHMASVILTLAWPTMLEQLMQTAVQYVDTAMVGSLGTQATAAVGGTTTLNWVVNGSIAAMGVGFLAFIAQAYGANDKKKAARASMQAVLMTILLGLFFTVLTLSLSRKIPVWMQIDTNIRTLTSEYFFIINAPMLFRAAITVFSTILRASGDTKTPMKVGIAVNLVNVSLNFLMIYPTRTIALFGLSVWIPGMGLGIHGAAIASAIAFVVGGIAITRALWRHPMLSPKGQRFAPDWSILRVCLKVAIPNMLQRFATSFGYVIFASQINSLGEASTAAHVIANTVESAFYIPGYGMQTAAATLAGNAYGARDRKRLHDLARMFIPIEVGLMVLSGGALFALAPVLVRIFSDAEDVIRLGTTVLRMVAVSEPFYGFSIIMEGMMQGTGNTKRPFFYNVIGMWGVRVVGTLLCIGVLHLGLVSAWGCMIAHNMLVFVLFLLSFIRSTWDPMRHEEIQTV